MLPLQSDPVVLAETLQASRARLERITCSLDGPQWLGPQLKIVNPPQWEMGHVAWFQEYWCLRRQDDGGFGASMLPNADALYDSARVAHATRWGLPLPDVAATRAYLAAVLERTLEVLQRRGDDATLQYFVRLALFHEDMHAEAFHYSRQTLGYADPLPGAPAPPPDRNRIGGDVAYSGGVFRLGAEPGDGFVFDNEKWAHEVVLAPFRMARTTVSNEEFATFADAGGYQQHEWWDADGWAWLQGSGRSAPAYWRQTPGGWQQRRFDRWETLSPQLPVMHVNWHEAQAYCRFAGRRLPSEAEWEFAAAEDSARKCRYPWGDTPPGAGQANLEGNAPVVVTALAAGDSPRGMRQMIGNVWEWTSTTFVPYPGFEIDPYKEYSAPWFGTHKVLRGGSFATPARLIRNTWRNFYTPDRADIFAGFRTCALD